MISPAYITKDKEGHWYIIPMDKKEEFTTSIETINSFEALSEDYYEAIDLFEEAFGKYRTGGDLNLVQLYADFSL